MKSTLDEFYDADFYAQHVGGMSTSSQAVLGHLYQLYQPKSVVDFGCGRGAWLATAGALGSSKLKGFDGSWIGKDSLLSQEIDFTPINLAQSIPKVDQKYDLCISLEVAEHIPEVHAKSFVDALCAASDTVLFSAAIKEQGGTNHINEQRQSYWIELFKQNGYVCFDAVRPHIWENNKVEWWYKQNTFLFCHSHSEAIDTDVLKQAERKIVDIVHPETFEERVRLFERQIQNPTLSFCLTSIKRYVTNKLLKKSRSAIKVYAVLQCSLLDARTDINDLFQQVITPLQLII